MIKMINGILYILKYLLLVVCFALGSYIILYMYERLDKSLNDTILLALPFVILFILFAINMLLSQKRVTSNLFYNLTCCFVFVVILFIEYRAIFDTYMIANSKLGYNINFNYFADNINAIKVMIIGLIIGDLLFMLPSSDDKKVKQG